MSKIQDLPQKVLDAITPYLVSGEVIVKSLLQDNKKPREIWLIKTNQAIILHGQQPDKPVPAIMVFALDELREIDYLQKPDDNQIILYSSKNNGKAVFHFEPTAYDDIASFLDGLADIVTYRYQTSIGKIKVYQKALPIGDKNRKVFGRGKIQEAEFLSKNKPLRTNDSKINTNIKVPPQKEETIKKTDGNALKSAEKELEQKNNNIQASNSLNQEKLDEKKSTISTNEDSNKTAKSQPKIEKKLETYNTATKTVKSENVNIIEKVTPALPIKEKVEKEDVKSNSNSSNKTIVKNSLISHLQENPIQEKKEDKNATPKKEIDFGNPIYFISITILATIIGFFCLSFFKTISKIVNYFKKN